LAQRMDLEFFQRVVPPLNNKATSLKLNGWENCYVPFNEKKYTLLLPILALHKTCAAMKSLVASVATTSQSVRIPTGWQSRLRME